MKWQYTLVPVMFFVSMIAGCYSDSLVPNASAKTITTNEVRMKDAPEWVSEHRVEKVVRRIQSLLEWDIRRVEVHWYRSADAFSRAHKLGTGVVAFARSSDHSVHLGPRVNNTSFDSVFGHELVHVILAQKFKGGIPKWLEEGLANYLTDRGDVNYAKLSEGRLPSDVRTLTHPFNQSEENSDVTPFAHYQLSRALVEMIASKCRLAELLQLSVGKNLENYLPTFCEISDLNAEFKKWIRKKI